MPGPFRPRSRQLGVSRKGVRAVSGLLADPGSAINMVVDGSTTPVVFSFPADANLDITPVELRIVVVGSSLALDGLTFGRLASALANGILVEIISDSGVLSTLANIQINEDFLRLASSLQSGNVLTEFTGVTDLIVASLHFNELVQLVAGTGDLVRITIRDDLTGAQAAMLYISATLHGLIGT